MSHAQYDKEGKQGQFWFDVYFRRVFLDLPAGVMNVYILTYCYKSDSKDFYLVSKDLYFK